MRITNVPRLAKLSITSPREFIDRTSAMVDVHLLERPCPPGTYELKTVDEFLSEYESIFGRPLRPYLEEPTLRGLEVKVVERQKALRGYAPFSQLHDSSPQIGNIIYCLTRDRKPAVMIETGVAYGVNTSYTLAALQESQHGWLHSIDLPPLGEHSDHFVGYLVPEELRLKWTLHRGTSSRILPKLVREVPRLDWFTHDSLHTRRNIAFELNTAKPAMPTGSVVIVDDATDNNAFASWVSSNQPQYSAVLAQDTKNSGFGVAIL